MFYVYMFINSVNDIVYVGKTNDINSRMISQSHLPQECYSSVSKVIYTTFNNEYDMELMEKLAERRIKIEATNDISTPGGRNPQNSGDIRETGSTGSTGDENAPSFTTREEYNKILKDMGFNRTRI